MSRVRDLLSGAELPGDSGRLEAELLLCHCLGESRGYLYTWPEQQVPQEQVSRYCQLLEARRAGKPLAYLTGEREFWSLSLKVNEHTLIPRPETETLVEWALELALPTEARVADWGTGSGAIALALASERPAWHTVAMDRSEAALSVAAANASALDLGRVQFLLADWGAAMGGASLDLVVSNPPYVAAGDPHLEAGDLPFEPESALVAGEDGLSAVRQVIADARFCLCPGGWLLLEHGYEQAAAVRELLHRAGFSEIASRSDLAGIERISGGKWP